MPDPEPSRKPIYCGVVGVGRLGSEHARLLADSPVFRLTGVYDTNRARAAAVASRTGCRCLDSAAALVDVCDAVVVAVPTMEHHQVAAAAIDAGCHVLIEKPIASDEAQARDLVDRAEARGVVLGVGHVERFNGLLEACEPYLERPRFFESLRLAAFQPRGTDVTVVLDLMIHDIDLVLALAGSPLRDVSAVGVSVLSGSVDMANARLAFEDGTVANITASRVSQRPLRQLRLFQRSAYFSLDLAAGRGEIRRRPGRTGAGPPAELETISIDAIDGEPLARELSAFAAAIRGERSRLVTGVQGCAALAVAMKITREIQEFSDVIAQDP